MKISTCQGSRRSSSHMVFQRFHLVGYSGAFLLNEIFCHCPYNGWSKAVVV